MYAILVKVEKTEKGTVHKVSKVAFKKEIRLDDMYRLIGCRLIDIQETKAFGIVRDGVCRSLSMVFDDEFLLYGDRVVNVLASLLYGNIECGELICGNVLLCDVDEEGASIGFSEQETDELMKSLKNLAVFANKNCSLPIFAMA